MRRRKTRRRKHRRRRPVFGLFLLLCVAVGSGYLGVRYVVSPWMDQQAVAETSGDEVRGEETEKTDGQDRTDEKEQEPTVVEDKVDTVATTAYAVQLGSFSSEEAANQRVKELKEQAITAKVQLRDHAWKVVSEGFTTRDEAKAAAIRRRDVIGDAFVVAI